MRNEIQVFTNEKFGSVRTTVIDGKPWFVGRDVAAALGIATREMRCSNTLTVTIKGCRKLRRPLENRP